MEKRFYLILSFVCLFMLINVVLGQTPYYFKRYPFAKKQRNDRRLKNLIRQCEGDERCQGLHGLEVTKCARQCMSQPCYQEMYAHDELEEGEIDVRYTSFKGCVYQHLPPRNVAK